MICPKCGRPVTESAVICPGCDFILDSGFLGEEVLDEEKDLRPGRGGIEPAVFNLADAVILGDIDEGGQNFETSDTGFHIKESTGARLYVSGRSQALMAPDAIPARVSGQTLHDLRLTPFERHILNFIDGERPVEAIKRETGLDDVEVKTGLATLADKGVIRVVGRALVEIKPMEKRKERRSGAKDRMRRELVGAVALVGGESDQAIEDAFRTQTSIPVPDFDGPRPPRQPLHRPETDVFHKILEDSAPDGSPRLGAREKTIAPHMRSMTVDPEHASFLDSSEPDSLDRDLQRVLDDSGDQRPPAARTNQIEDGRDGVFSAESDGFDDFGDASGLSLDSGSESDLRPSPPLNRDLSSDLSETGSAPDLKGGGQFDEDGRPQARSPFSELDAEDDDAIFDEETAGALPKDLQKNDSMSFNDEFTAGTVARMNKSAIHRLANSEIDQLSVDDDASKEREVRRPIIQRPEPTRAVLNPMSDSLSGLLSDDGASDAQLAAAANALQTPPAVELSHQPLARQATQISAIPASLLSESVDNFTDSAYSEIYDDLSSEEGSSDEEPSALHPSSFAVERQDLPDRKRAGPQAETTGLHALAALDRAQSEAQAKAQDDKGEASAADPGDDQMSLASILEPAAKPSSEAPASAHDLSALSDPFPSESDGAALPPSDFAAELSSEEKSDESRPPDDAPPSSFEGSDTESVAVGSPSDDDELSNELDNGAQRDTPPSDLSEDAPDGEAQNPPAHRPRTEAVELSIDGSLGASAPSSFESFSESDVVGKPRLESDDASLEAAPPGQSLDAPSVPDPSAESLLPAPSFEMAAPAGSSFGPSAAADDDPDGPAGRGPPDAVTDPHASPVEASNELSDELSDEVSDEAGSAAFERGVDDESSLSASEAAEEAEDFEDASTAAIEPDIGAAGDTRGLAGPSSGATAIISNADELFSRPDGASPSGASEAPPAATDEPEPHNIALGAKGAENDATGRFEVESSAESEASDAFDDDSAESGFEDEPTAAIDLNEVSSIEIRSQGNAAPISSAPSAEALDSDESVDRGEVELSDAQRTHAFDADEARKALGLDDDKPEAAKDGPHSGVFDTGAMAPQQTAPDVEESDEDDLSSEEPEVTAHLAHNPFDESLSRSSAEKQLDEGPQLDDDDDNDVARTNASDAGPLGPPPPSSGFISDEADDLGITDNVKLGDDADLEAYVPKNAATALLGALSDVAAPVDDEYGSAFRRAGTDGSLVDPPSEELQSGINSAHEQRTGVFIPESSLLKRRNQSSAPSADPAHRPPALVEASDFGPSHEGFPPEEIENTRGGDLHSAATGILDDDDAFESAPEEPASPNPSTRAKSTLGSIADLDTQQLQGDESSDHAIAPRGPIRPAAPVAANLRDAAGRVQRPVGESGAIAASAGPGLPPKNIGGFQDTENRASFAYSSQAPDRDAHNPLLDELSEIPDGGKPPDEETDYARKQESNSRFESFPEEEHTVNIEALSSDESSLPDFNDATAAIEPLQRGALESVRSDVFATEQLPLPPRLAAQARAEAEAAAQDDAKPRVGNGRGNAAPISVGDTGDLPELPPSPRTAPPPPSGSRTGSRQGTDMRGKAQALFDDAMRDYQAGRIGAARMNAKLAAIYDPGNEEYRHALEQWERAPTGRSRQQVPPEVALYERAQEAESEGDVERALELLREGISLNPDVPAIHNRLGVLLALQKRDYDAAAAAIRRAIELEPDNLHYKNNLGKIVARAQSHDAR